MDPVFFIRGRPNSDIFLPDLRKLVPLFKKGKFFVALKMS